MGAGCASIYGNYPYKLGEGCLRSLRSCRVSAAWKRVSIACKFRLCVCQVKMLLSSMLQLAKKYEIQYKTVAYFAAQHPSRCSCCCSRSFPLNIYWVVRRPAELVPTHFRLINANFNGNKCRLWQSTRYTRERERGRGREKINKIGRKVEKP